MASRNLESVELWRQVVHIDAHVAMTAVASTQMAALNVFHGEREASYPSPRLGDQAPSEKSLKVSLANHASRRPDAAHARFHNEHRIIEIQDTDVSLLLG